MRVTLDHVHIYSDDVEASIRFYTSVLDGEWLGKLATEHESHNHFVILGGQIVVLSRFPPGLEPATPPAHGNGALRTGYGVAHFGINVDDLDAAIERLRRAGIEPHAPTAGSGKIRYVYFTAPDGVVIELTEYRLPPKLARLAKVAALTNRAIHQVRRLMTKQLFRE